MDVHCSNDYLYPATLCAAAAHDGPDLLAEVGVLYGWWLGLGPRRAPPSLPP